MKDAWDGYYAAKRTPVNEDGREEAAREQESATGYVVNEDRSALVVCDSERIRYVFHGAEWAVDRGVLEVFSDGGPVASFAMWISVVKVSSDEEAMDHLNAAKKDVRDALDQEPGKQWMPRRANLQQR